MTPNFSNEIFRLLHTHGGEPVKVEHPHSGEVCWIVTDQQKQFLTAYDDSGEVDPREVSQLVDQVMAADDADDPALASYQHITKES